jgi:CBS domain containing-hemolysin-like protein
MNQGSWQFFLFLICISLSVEAFFSMMEMGCVSFNRVRLQYYISQGNRRAKWIGFLLNHPTRLFGTTLIGVNAALQFGSECARRFYIALGLSPDWAPLSQIFLVIILAELSPMFAARRYAEHVSMLGIPIIYLFCKLMTPFVWFLNGVCFVINKIFHLPPTEGMHLTREELQKAIEAREDATSADPGDFDMVVSNIFALKNKSAKDLMQPIEKGKLIPASSYVAHVRETLDLEYSPYLPMFHISKQNIVAIVYPRDLLKAGEEDFARQFARQPWFILEKNSVLQILKQFRKNNQSVAIVLNQLGLATGILTLDMVVEEIFGPKNYEKSLFGVMDRTDQVVIEKSFPGETKIQEINDQLNIHLPVNTEVLTLEELMTKELGHRPNKGDHVRVEQFELRMEEGGLLQHKKISIRTVF